MLLALLFASANRFLEEVCLGFKVRIPDLRKSKSKCENASPACFLPFYDLRAVSTVVVVVRACALRQFSAWMIDLFVDLETGVVLLWSSLEAGGRVGAHPRSVLVVALRSGHAIAMAQPIKRTVGFAVAGAEVEAEPEEVQLAFSSDSVHLGEPSLGVGSPNPVLITPHFEGKNNVGSPLHDGGDPRGDTRGVRARSRARARGDRSGRSPSRFRAPPFRGDPSRRTAHPLDALREETHPETRTRGFGKT